MPHIFDALGYNSGVGTKQALGNISLRTPGGSLSLMAGYSATQMQWETVLDNYDWNRQVFLVTVSAPPNIGGSGLYHWSVTGLVLVGGAFSSGVQYQITWQELARHVPAGAGATITGTTALWKTSGTAFSTPIDRWYVRITGTSLTNLGFGANDQSTIIRIH